MTGIMTVTEDDIRKWVTEQSFERGTDYYHSGMVESVVLRGNRLFAEVMGSEWEPYQVSVSFRGDDYGASCTCPYDWGGYCKHIVAVLLTFMHDGDSITVRPPVEDLLSKLESDELMALVVQMIESDPKMVDVVDTFCSQAVP